MGFALGSLAGSALFPTQLPAGPQLTDNRTTTSTIGEPVPILAGTACVSGTVIWLAPYVESENNVGSKGGPQQEQYSYQQSIAIGFCEAIKDGDTAIAGVSRIWENGTLVYDIRPQQPASTELGTLAETDDQYADRLAASAVYAETFVLYLGSEDQMPDPTIVAIEGVGMTPAFRGLAYIVYPLRLLQTAQAWRHPNFKFECYQAGTGLCTDTTEYSNHVLYPWADMALNANTYQITNMDSAAVNFAAYEPTVGTIYPSLPDALAAAATFYGHSMDVLFGYAITQGSWDLNVIGGPSYVTRPALPDPCAIDLHYGFQAPAGGFYSVDQPGGGGGLYSIPGSQWWYAGTVTLTLGEPGSDDTAPSWPSPYTHGSRYTPAFWFAQITDLVITVTRYPSPPADPCTGLTPVPELSGYAFNAEGNIVKCGAWTYDTTKNYKVLQQLSGPLGEGGDELTVVVKYPLNPCIPAGGAEYDDEAFWTAAYAAAVANGQMAGGLTYNEGYPVIQDWGYAIDAQVCEGGGAAASVGAFIAAICQRAGLTAIDVSDMNDIYMDGYAISQVCSATSILTPLRSIAFFDAVDSGTVLRFQSRGKPIVATFTTDDFGCYDGGGADDKVPPSITVARADESTLPRTIRLHYVASSRDYESGEQDSPFRLTSSCVNDVDVQLPMVLGDTQAIQAAEVIWADAWAQQNGYTLAVDQSWSALECGDCIGVPVDGVIQRIRIVSDSNASGVLRTMKCVADDEGAYISFAVANAPLRLPQTLTLLCGTQVEFLDLPALQDSDSNPGFYMAAQRTETGNRWKGCVVYQSIDGGLTFTPQFSLTTEATIGTLQAAIPASQCFVFDDTTEILVNVLDATFTFESITDSAVLSGGNAAAMGAPGRWEIVQFATAELVSPTQWKLTRLLRGRRGTEYVCGSSTPGDTLVMLSTGDLNRVLLSTAQIGASFIYKSVSIGASYGSGVDTPFAGHAQALMPFSPVDLKAEGQTSGNILLSWTRRDRLGRTLMSGVDMPLSEATLAFQVDILGAGSPAVVLRTLTTSSTSVVYALADWEADFDTPPASLLLHVYQMSAVVGRGIPAIATVTLEGHSI